MIEKIIRAVIVAVVLYIVYFILAIAIAALGLPALISMLAGILLLLAFCVYLLRLFGINL